uniref:PLAC8 like 1 n=2 Tax=Crocodylus porosus TaxID=8502 RepID=A0A7M4EL76_CROPO
MSRFGCHCLRASEEVLLPEMQSPLILSLTASEDGAFFLDGPRPAQPVTTQPTSRASMSTITTVVQTGGDWTTGLFGVCSDKRVCVCGALCCPCLECNLARHYGECLCFPLLPGSTLALRVGVRERHRIRGTLCEDWMAVHCCWPFAVCQAARELKRRATTQIYEVNAAPAAIDAPVLKCPATELEL